MKLCPRICIDDLCRGNRENTLCGGSYCDDCGTLTVDEGRCEECRDEDGNIDGWVEYIITTNGAQP